MNALSKNMRKSLISKLQQPAALDDAHDALSACCCTADGRARCAERCPSGASANRVNTGAGPSVTDSTGAGPVREYDTLAAEIDKRM